jgi:Methyltransferase domain
MADGLEVSGREVAANRELWTRVNAEYTEEHAFRAWGAQEIAWGIFNVPETQVGALGDVSGLDVAELGCGTAYLSAWLARRGARPVGVDLTAAQLDTARRCQDRFGISFPLVEADAGDARSRCLRPPSCTSKPRSNRRWRPAPGEQPPRPGLPGRAKPRAPDQAGLVRISRGWSMRLGLWGRVSSRGSSPVAVAGMRMWWSGVTMVAGVGAWIRPVPMWRRPPSARRVMVALGWTRLVRMVSRGAAGRVLGAALGRAARAVAGVARRGSERCGRPGVVTTHDQVILATWSGGGSG